MDKRPEFSFTHDAGVAEFTVPTSKYLDTYPDASFGYIATSALVVDSRAQANPRLLLLQRAASDSNPNKWEPPGGASDDDDPSILHAAARELWEETGLMAAHIAGLAGHPYIFTLRNGKRVCRFNFTVYAERDDGVLPVVQLDPKEHQKFVWATEDEVRAGKVGDIDLHFTREEVARTSLQVLEKAGQKEMHGIDICLHDNDTSSGTAQQKASPTANGSRD